jgi:hypothetical protein
MSATSVISYASVNWSNTCLGVQPPKTACADMITPGYRIVLKAGDRTYEFHTDGDGGNYVLVDPAGSKAPEVMGGDVLLAWHREGGFAGFCDNVTVMTDGQYQVTPCKGRKTPVMTTLQLDVAQSKQLNGWVNHYKLFSVAHQGPINPDELVVEFTFYGHGDSEPTAEDKQAINLFAQLLRNSIR